MDKFDTSSMQWNHWKEQFELQMLANEVDEDYWVKLASYNLDDRAYKAYEHWSGMVTRNQNISWDDFAQLMERQFQRKQDPGLAQVELRAFRWKREKPFSEFAMDLYDALQVAFPNVGPAELESIGSSFLLEKIPGHWQDKLDVLHQKDLAMSTFSHDSDQCVSWEKSEGVKAQKK